MQARRCVLLVLIACFVLSLGFAPSRDVHAQDAVTIQYWNINSDTFGGPQVEALIASFEAANPGITVVARSFSEYQVLQQTLETSIAGGNPPDVVQTAYPYLNYVGTSLPFVPVSELVAKYGGEEFLAQFPQHILDIPVVNGEQIGMAYSLSVPVVYYNADLMAEAGLDPDNPPQTIDEWREAGAIIQDKLGIRAIVWGYEQDNWTTQGFINSAGGDLLACVDGELKAVFDSEEAIQGLRTWRELIEAGYSLDASNEEARQALLAGHTVAWVHSIAARAGIQRDADFDLRATLYPQHGEKPVRVPGGGNFLTIYSQDSARQKAAWEFVQHLQSPEGFTEWTKGTGYVPLLPGLTEDPAYLADFVAENPIQEVGMDMLGYAVTWVSFPGPNGLAAGLRMHEAAELILSGQQEADVALTDAAADINDLIAGQACGN